MSKKKIASKASSAPKKPKSEKPMSHAAETELATSAPAPAATAVAALPPVPAVIAAAPSPAALVELPPAGANIPIPPSGFVATAGTDYRGITPKRAELAVLPKALEELGRFTDYTAVFGKTAPPLASLQQTLNAALQWSLMRNSTDAWDLFSRTMEGIAWTQARALMDRLNPTFAAAVATDSTIQSDNPSLAALLNVASVIAQRGAATRKAAAAKARKEAKTASQPESTESAAAQGISESTPAAATAATPAAPPPAPAPTGPAPTGTNGAPH